MYGLARPYYRRVRFVTAALVEGSEAVSAQQYDSVLGSGRPMAIAGIGLTGLVAILYLMLFKPALGLTPNQGLASNGAASPITSSARGATVSLAATELAFNTDHLSVPAGKRFTMALDNRAPGVSHNVTILTSGGEVLFRGDLVSGPKRVTYQVPALKAGSYRFLCEVHPQQMTGTLVAK
jgi:plastocyanin